MKNIKDEMYLFFYIKSNKTSKFKIIARNVVILALLL